MDIEFYKKENGKVPIQEFLDSLPKKLKEKTLMSIYRLKVEGYKIRYPYAEKITSEIWELRTKMGSDITRIMYLFYDGQKVILTNGFLKKTQKTPRNEIKRAEDYRNDYFRRNDNG